MRKSEQDLKNMEAEIATLKIEANSPYNDGWLSEHYRKELDKSNAEYAKSLSEGESAPERTVYEQQIELANGDALLADGFEKALIGYEAAGSRAVYCYQRCMEILMERDNMTQEEAHEFMEFNVVSAYVGDFTPLFVSIFAPEQIGD
tara:strand:- start:1227 stop:1667 length:441 start_codon:yes stop_codon:yes gene_type:complete